MDATNQTATRSFPTPFAAVGVVISSIVILVNLSVLIIFLKSKTVRENRHHNLVICLSIGDLTLGISGLIASCRLLIPAWSGAFIPCLVSGVLIAVAVFMSLFQTFLISFHRFLVSYNSAWNDRLLKGKRKYAIYVISWSCVMTWLFALVSPKSMSDVKVCNIIVIYGGNFHIFSRIYGIQVMLLLISTILLYIFTVNNVRKRYMKTFAFQMENVQRGKGQIRTENTSDGNNLNITEMGKRKVFESLKVVGIIIALLILFTGPFVMLIFITNFSFCPSHSRIFVVCCLTTINSALNPFVYCWKIDSLRKEFKTIFRMCLKSEQ
jgi:hypothetical protein